MSNVYVSEPAGARIDSIYRYTRKTWGEPQARKYITGLFECFEQIANRQKPWRVIPADFGVDGFYAPYEKHFIFWRNRADGGVSILSVLGQNMDVGARLGDDIP